MYCSNCGSKLNKDSNFCHVCGHRVKDVEVYIRKIDMPLPDQIKIEDLEDKKTDTEAIEESSEKGFLERIKAFSKKDAKDKGPLSGAHEVAFKFDEKKDKSKKEDSKKLEDKKDVSIKKPKKEIIERESPEKIEKETVESIEDKTEEVEIIEKEADLKEPSIFKRFLDFMKEDEYYDDSIFKQDKSEEIISKKDEDLDDIDRVSLSQTQDTLEEKNIETEYVPPTTEEEKVVDKETDQLVEKEKKPSIFKRIKNFVDEEDEDNLLEMSPEEYRETFYGQGALEDLEEDSEIDEGPKTVENEIVEKTESKSFFDKIFSFFKEPEEEKDEELDYEDEIEEDDEEVYIPSYSYVDKEKTIRYSKRVIDSYLKKHEEGKLDIKDFDNLDQFPIEEDVKVEKEEKVDFPIPEFEKKEKKEELKEEKKSDPKPIEEPDDFEIPEFEIKEKEETDTSDLEEDKPEEDEIGYYELIVEKPIQKPYEDFSEEIDDTADEIEEPKEKTDFFKPVKEFFISIGKFFSTSKETEKKEEKKDNIDIIINAPADSNDTMPLVLSREEKEILNKEIDKRQKGGKDVEILKKSNAKIAPFIRKLIDLGAKFVIPLALIVLIGLSYTISWTISNPVFIALLGFLKFIILYATISAATNSAFNSIGLRLKRSVISLFVFLQMLLYLIIDGIYIKLTLIPGETVEALLHVLSPKILTIVVFVFLAFFLLVLNYRKIKEKNGTLVFMGWYIVISSAITLVVILLELLLSTILMTLFKEIMF